MKFIDLGGTYRPVVKEELTADPALVLNNPSQDDEFGYLYWINNAGEIENYILNPIVTLAIKRLVLDKPKPEQVIRAVEIPTSAADFVVLVERISKAVR